jgi:Protein of unknown function (DUF4236)
MGWRYRRSVKILPGLKINLSKTGASLSVGRPGATVNFGKRGVRSTLSIPGTGMSYVTQHSLGQRARQTSAPTPRSSQQLGGAVKLLLIGLGAIAAWAILHWL